MLLLKLMHWCLSASLLLCMLAHALAMHESFWLKEAPSSSVD